MGVLSRRTGLVSVLTLASASIAVIGSGALAVSAAAAVAMPNPCPVLAAAHSSNTIARGHHVNAGKVKVSTSTSTYRACSQVVGSITVHLGIVLWQDIGDAVSRHSRHSVSGWLLVIAFGIDCEPAH